MALADSDLRWVVCNAAERLLGVSGSVDKQRWFAPMTEVDVLLHLESQPDLTFEQQIARWGELGTLSWPRAIEPSAIDPQLADGLASLVIGIKAGAPGEGDFNSLVGHHAAVRTQYPDRALIPMMVSTEEPDQGGAEARDQHGLASLTLAAASVDEAVSACGFATGKPELEQSELATESQRELVAFQSEFLSDVEGLKKHIPAALTADARLRQLRLADMLARAFADRRVGRFDLATTALYSSDVLADGTMGSVELLGKRVRYDICHFFKSPKWPRNHPGILQLSTGSMALLFKLGFNKKVAEARYAAFIKQATRLVPGFHLRKDEVRSWPILVLDRQLDQSMPTFCRLFVDVYKTSGGIERIPTSLQI